MEDEVVVYLVLAVFAVSQGLLWVTALGTRSKIATNATSLGDAMHEALSLSSKLHGQVNGDLERIESYSKEHGHWTTAYQRVVLGAGDEWLETPGDHLTLAYLLHARKDYRAATEQFAKTHLGIQAMSTSDESNHPLRARVQREIDEIRPFIQRDGGDIELVDVSEEGEVRVRLQGACVGCPMSQMTMTMGVERKVRQAVPQVTKVTLVPPES